MTYSCPSTEAEPLQRHRSRLRFRHSFAGIAEELGASLPTIAALLRHRLAGVTGGYILKRVDVLLVDSADRIADHIATQMRGEVPTSNIVQFHPRGRLQKAAARQVNATQENSRGQAA